MGISEREQGFAAIDFEDGSLDNWSWNGSCQVIGISGDAYDELFTDGGEWNYLYVSSGGDKTKGCSLSYTVDVPEGTGNGSYCPISYELADFNGDGFLDLVSGNGGDLDQVFPCIYRKEVPEAVDHILLNDRTGRFTTAMPIIG